MDEIKKYVNIEAVKGMTFKEFNKIAGDHPVVKKYGGSEKVYEMIVPKKVKKED